MASGYVIAAVLELAGLFGLVLALFRIQAERRTKAAELRSFLRSGQGGSSALDIGALRRRTDYGARVVTVPATAARSGAVANRDSAARSALRRAVLRRGQRFQSDRTVPLSAG
jgi:hypothetical protein